MYSSNPYHRSYGEDARRVAEREVAVHVRGERLPIDDFREQIMGTIARERVVVISGETGCGKSSRIPTFLLEHAEARGERCEMFVSQPRRIAVHSLMKRMRLTLGDKVGMRMGHGTRETSDKTIITFATTGYLVRLLAHHPEAFASHTHLIIDEVHERSIDGDVLCMLARRLLGLHPTIKLVLMSATAHTQLYQSYFGMALAHHFGRDFYGRDIPSLAVGVRRFPVETLQVEELDYCAHVNNEFDRHANTRISSLCRGIFGVCQNLSGRFDEDIPEALSKMQYDLAEELVRNGNFALGSAVLIFVSGISDINNLYDRFCASDEDEALYEIVVIHSDIPFEDQQQAFEPVLPTQMRIIIATNAAESSITLPSVDVILCLGTHKALRYHEGSHRTQLDNAWISKASATQRAGRTGRVRPGKIYRLYSRGLLERFHDHELAEVHRQPLQNTILGLRSMMEDAKDFQGVKPILANLIEPPAMRNIDRSFDYLYATSMITAPGDHGQLTVIGKLAGALPFDLSLGRMVALGIILGSDVGSAATIVACALSQPKSLFRIASPLIHRDPDELYEIVRQVFIGQETLDAGVLSEPIMMLKMLTEWKSMEHHKTKQTQWAMKHGVVISRMKHFCSASINLLDTVNTQLGPLADKSGGGRGRRGHRHSNRLSFEAILKSSGTKVLKAGGGGVVLSPSLLNALRLVIAWSMTENLFVQVTTKTKNLVDYSMAKITSPVLLSKSHIKSLFPNQLQTPCSLETVSRTIYQAPLLQSKSCSTQEVHISLLKQMAHAARGEIAPAVWLTVFSHGGNGEEGNSHGGEEEQQQEEERTIVLFAIRRPREEEEAGVVAARSVETDCLGKISRIFKNDGDRFSLVCSFDTAAADEEEGVATTSDVLLVSSPSQSEKIALTSLPEYLPASLSMLLPRTSPSASINAQLLAANMALERSALEAIFCDEEQDADACSALSIKEQQLVVRQVLSFPPTSPPVDALPISVSSLNLLDLPIGLRLLKQYEAQWKDKHLRVWRNPGKPSSSLEQKQHQQERQSGAQGGGGAGGGGGGGGGGMASRRAVAGEDTNWDEDETDKLAIKFVAATHEWFSTRDREKALFPRGGPVYSAMQTSPTEETVFAAVNDVLRIRTKTGTTLLRCLGVTILSGGRWLTLAMRCLGLPLVNDCPVDHAEAAKCNAINARFQQALVASPLQADDELMVMIDKLFFGEEAEGEGEEEEEEGEDEAAAAAVAEAVLEDDEDEYLEVGSLAAAAAAAVVEEEEEEDLDDEDVVFKPRR